MSALIWCPVPDVATARQLASQLLDEKLIACANIIGPFVSLFEWDGERGEGSEYGLLLKTDESCLQDAVARLEILHPYDAPAIIGWPCPAAGDATRTWLEALASGGNPA